MPLEKGPGKAKFEHNLKAELAAGKPKTQALAIALSEAKKIRPKPKSNKKK
jgi:hypothetical protein